MNITLTGTKVSLDTHTLAFAKNNLVNEIICTVDTDESWTYRIDVLYSQTDCSGNPLYNIINLNRTGNVCSASLTIAMLPFSGKYTMQLRGIKDQQIYHSDIFEVWVKYSIDPSNVYDPVPSEFYQIEDNIIEINNHPPYPDISGFWMIWNPTTHKYELSTIPIPTEAGGGEVNQNAWSNISVKKQSAATTAVTGAAVDTTIAATTKTDTFSVASGNKWVDVGSDGKQINIGHNLSGVTAGTYSDGTHVAKIVVDKAGHITSAEQVAINFPEVTVPVYDIVKDADSGDYADIYHLTKDGTNTGAAINIPKDLFVKEGKVVDNPTGQPAGKYIELTLQNQTDPIYINVADLVDAYTPGNGITISATNVVSANVVAANGLVVGASGIAIGLASADENGAMSSGDFSKLAGINEGATANTITLNGTATKTPSFYAPTTGGTEGQQLVSNGTGAPTWQDMPTILKKYTATNGALTATGGAFTWTITATTHGVTTPATVQLFEVSNNEQVIANVAIAENGNVTITINGTGSLAAGTYRAVIIG